MKKGILLLFLALFFAGCESMYPAVEKSKNLRVGMTKEEVLAIMGEPLTEESFCRPNIWFYYVETIWADGLNTEDECMPLVFVDGKLAGWGREYYNDYRRRPKYLPQLPGSN